MDCRDRQRYPSSLRGREGARQGQQKKVLKKLQHSLLLRGFGKFNDWSAATSTVTKSENCDWPHLVRLKLLQRTGTVRTTSSKERFFVIVVPCLCDVTGKRPSGSTHADYFYCCLRFGRQRTTVAQWDWSAPLPWNPKG